MKNAARFLLIGLIAHTLMNVQAIARGEFPPPPPFMGGNQGAWLGSGPIFGFEPGGGSMGGWGGGWWQGGGWGGWGYGSGGSGVGYEPGGYHNPGGGGGWPSDTGGRGNIWEDPNQGSGFFSRCYRHTAQGGYSECGCQVSLDPASPPTTGDWVAGTCVRIGGIRMYENACEMINTQCIGQTNTGISSGG